MPLNSGVRPTMSNYESAFFVALFLLGSLIFLLPVAPAWFYSRSSGEPFPRRRTFIAACCLLSYGFLTAAGAFFVPLELMATFLAPQWQRDGHELAAQVVSVGSTLNIYVPAFIGAVAAFVVPRWLSVRWRRIAPGLA